MDINRHGGIAAATALGAATLLFAVALVRALTLLPETPAEPQVSAPAPAEMAANSSGASPRVPSETTLAPADLALAVDNDPFQPGRTRPEPFRLPGEELTAVAPAPEVPPAPEFQVVGTIVDAAGGLAVIQVPDSPPRVLGVGDELLGYRLERVGETSATMVGSGRSLELTLASASPAAGQPATARGRSAADRQSQITGELLRTLQQRMGPAFAQQLLRAQQGGASPAELQALLRQMAEQGTGMGRGGAPRIIFRRDTLDAPQRTPRDPGEESR